MSEIKEYLKAFTIAQLQTAGVIYEWLRINDKTMEDLLHHVKIDIIEEIEAKEQFLRRQKAIRELSPKCEKCESVMSLSPGDEENAFWDCRKCGWSKLANSSMESEVRSLNLKLEDKLNGQSNPTK